MNLKCKFTEYVKQGQDYVMLTQKDCEINEYVLYSILESKPYHEAQGGVMNLKYSRNKLKQITCISYDKKIKRVYSFI